MKNGFTAFFVAILAVVLVLGTVLANQLFKMQYTLTMLTSGSNIYASIAANLEQGNIDHAKLSLRHLAWVDIMNQQYAVCMYNISWHLFTDHPNESCKSLLGAPMPADWQIPGIDKILKAEKPQASPVF